MPCKSLFTQVYSNCITRLSTMFYKSKAWCKQTKQKQKTTVKEVNWSSRPANTKTRLITKESSLIITRNTLSWSSQWDNTTGSSCGGRLRVVPAPTCLLHLYLFNTGLFYSRSQPTPYTARCPAEDRCSRKVSEMGRGKCSFRLISLKSVLLLGHPLQGAVPDPSRPRQGPFFHFPSLCVPPCDNTHHILFTTCEPPEGRDWLFISHPQFNKCCWMNKWTLKIQLTALVLPLTDNNWVLPKEAL